MSITLSHEALPPPLPLFSPLPLQALFHSLLQSPCPALRHEALRSLVVVCRTSSHGDIRLLIPPNLFVQPGGAGGISTTGQVYK